MWRCDVEVWDSTGVAHSCLLPGLFCGIWALFKNVFGPFTIWTLFWQNEQGTVVGLRLFCRRRRARLQEIRALLLVTQGSLTLHFE